MNKKQLLSELNERLKISYDENKYLLDQRDQLQAELDKYNAGVESWPIGVVAIQMKELQAKLDKAIMERDTWMNNYDNLHKIYNKMRDESDKLETDKVIIKRSYNDIGKCSEYIYVLQSQYDFILAECKVMESRLDDATETLYDIKVHTQSILDNPIPSIRDCCDAHRINSVIKEALKKLEV
jgi:predicted nuclease with TOPRIM domain